MTQINIPPSHSKNIQDFKIASLQFAEVKKDLKNNNIRKPVLSPAEGLSLSIWLKKPQSIKQIDNRIALLQKKIFC